MFVILIVLIVLLWSVTSGSHFWFWLATRNGRQLFLITVIVTILLWAAAQIAGFGPK